MILIILLMGLSFFIVIGMDTGRMFCNLRLAQIMARIERRLTKQFQTTNYKQTRKIMRKEGTQLPQDP